MSMITEAASYRGVVVEHAIGGTKKGLPQLVVKLRALEQYDFDEKHWVDIQDRVECEITAFLVMFNDKGDPIFHVKDIQRVFEWDGASLVALNELDLEGGELQFEVISDTYNNTTRMKVARISKHDDVPGSGAVQKMEPEALAQMNAKFGNSLKTLAGAPKAAKAPATAPAKPTAKPPAKPTTTKAPAPPKKATTKAKAKATPPPPPAASAAEVEAKVEAAAAESAAATAPLTDVQAAPAEAAEIATLTYEEAWAVSCSRKSESVTDEQLATIFTAAMYRVAPDQDENSISGEDWVKIADAVVAECGVA